ncbi:MAG: hypothetical protein HY445_01705 [Candidatus Niyogibacteria bacterium]|nr:hypothetical protein [Candidatus Niyogibacteria bacterium]
MAFKRVIPFLILIALVIAGFGTAAYFYSAFNNVRENPQQIAQEEAAEVMGRVSELMILPGDEDPNIFTVTDPERLRAEQAFFKDVSFGDRLIIYTNNQRAILYNPTAHKIVNVAPFLIGGAGGAAQ